MLRNPLRNTRRVKFWFGRRGRRWAFSPRYMMMIPRRIRFGTRPKQDNVAAPTLLEPAPVRIPTWPLIAKAGSLEVRVAETEEEIIAAQELRYRVFYEEMSAIPSSAMRSQRRDFDKYDAYCDHILVMDNEARDEKGRPKVVGTYRLLRSDVAAMNGGFYTSNEYNLSTMLDANPPGTRFLELGRSCVLKSYRTKPITMQLLWRGVVMYNLRYGIELMFGCGSLPGTDPEALKLELSYLHHFHRAPEGHRTRARDELYVEMNRIPKDEIDAKEALRKLPPLIKGYVRAGSFIGDGAVVDKQFGTTDVLIYFPVSRIGERWRSHLSRQT